MRIAIVTESFLPQANGVTTSVCRVLDVLAEAGHETCVVAPDPAPTAYRGFAVHAVRSVPVRQFQVGLPTGHIEAVLAAFGPDVVHVASPFFLGARGLKAARNLGIPSVAIYQTDMAAYVNQHGGSLGSKVGPAAARLTWQYLRRVHALADLTLAPSTAALADLDREGIPRTAIWGRGVDTKLFQPRWRDDAACRALRRRLAPNGEIVVGYVGRLAPEKQVERLAVAADLPGVAVAITGDGPSLPALREALPSAVFLGRRDGDDLARAYAACDVFVHTGTHETFGQTLQEAAAVGLPVIAPAVGGPLDVVDHEVTGLLFDPDDPDDLRRCLRRLTIASDAWQERALFGEAGRAAVAGRGWPALVGQLLDRYAALVAARHPAGTSSGRLAEPGSAA